CVAAPFGGGGLVHCYLIDAPRRTIVDTGTAIVPRESLLPALREIGWDVSDIRYIVNTHMHGDHAGGNAELKELSGADIHMHRADTDRIDPRAYLQAMQPDQLLLGEPTPEEAHVAEVRVLEQLGNAWGVDRVLEEGDSIDLGDDIRLQVLHTPGHTAGSASFYWESAAAVFSGDAVGGRGSRVNGYPLYSFASDYRQSLERLLELPIEYLMQAHRYRWSRDETPAVREGEAVRHTLQDSIGVWQAIDDGVRTSLAANPNAEFKELFPQVLRTVAPALGNDPDFAGVPSGALSTIAAHWREQRNHP
ncbi:MAG TPA: MBL fold metallo-hydrolase, partial [Chloroflexota bacterium]|nr:MBL fold metallo-hydrolase [Chloroflexota bacterium]